MIAAWLTKLRRPFARRQSHRDRIDRARMGLDPELAAILACPQDKGPLYYVPDDDLLYNPRLARTYAINAGIPVLLIDEASELEPAMAAALDVRIAAGELRPTFEP